MCCVFFLYLLARFSLLLVLEILIMICICVVFFIYEESLGSASLYLSLAVEDFYLLFLVSPSVFSPSGTPATCLLKPLEIVPQLTVAVFIRSLLSLARAVFLLLFSCPCLLNLVQQFTDTDSIIGSFSCFVSID